MKKILTLSIIISFTFSAFAQKIDIKKAKFAVNNFLIKEKKEYLAKQACQIFPILSENKKDTLAFVFNYPRNFVVLSARKEFFPIKAFSFENNYSYQKNKDNTSLHEILSFDYNQMNKNLKYSSKEKVKKQWENLLNAENKISIKASPSAEYGPLLSSVYGQANCKDENGSYINVTNTHTPNNWSVGCVALTLTECMQYFEYPVHGIGSKTYTDGGSSQTLTANFEDTYYQWDKMLNEYYQKSSTIEQREALGELAYQAAVALSMYFTSSGSSSDVIKIPRAAYEYLRYSSHYEAINHPNFWQMVQDNIIDGLPLQFAVYTSGGDGHAIVCDGVKDSGDLKYYHLNMGWWGSSNAWYNTENSFNAGGYSIISGGIFDILPLPELENPQTFEDKNSAEIHWSYTNKFSNTVFELQVKRDDFDWITLNDAITDTFYTVNVNNYSTYKYRVRAKHNNKTAIESWSEEKDLHRVLSSVKRNDYLSKYIKVFPQPANDEFNIDINLPQTTKDISIFTLSGKLVLSNTLEQNESMININTTNWKSGIYILKIRAGKEFFARKILIQ